MCDARRIEILNAFTNELSGRLRNSVRHGRGVSREQVGWSAPRVVCTAKVRAHKRAPGRQSVLGGFRAAESKDETSSAKGGQSVVALHVVVLAHHLICLVPLVFRSRDCLFQFDCSPVRWGFQLFHLGDIRPVLGRLRRVPFGGMSCRSCSWSCFISRYRPNLRRPGSGAASPS